MGLAVVEAVVKVEEVVEVVEVEEGHRTCKYVFLEFPQNLIVKKEVERYD